jgi:hypothetical protein
LGPPTHRGLRSRAPHRRVVAGTPIGHAIDTDPKDISFTTKSPSQTGPGLSQQTKPPFGPNAQRESTWLLLDDIRLFAVLTYKPPHRCEIRVLSLALRILCLSANTAHTAAHFRHSSANNVLIGNIGAFRCALETLLSSRLCQRLP